MTVLTTVTEQDVLDIYRFTQRYPHYRVICVVPKYDLYSRNSVDYLGYIGGCIDRIPYFDWPSIRPDGEYRTLNYLIANSHHYKRIEHLPALDYTRYKEYYIIKEKSKNLLFTFILLPEKAHYKKYKKMTLDSNEGHSDILYHYLHRAQEASNAGKYILNAKYKKCYDRWLKGIDIFKQYYYYGDMKLAFKRLAYSEKRKYLVKAAKRAKKIGVETVYDPDEKVIYFETAKGQCSFHDFIGFKRYDIPHQKHTWSGLANTQQIIEELTGEKF